MNIYLADQAKSSYLTSLAFKSLLLQYFIYISPHLSQSESMIQNGGTLISPVQLLDIHFTKGVKKKGKGGLKTGTKR